MFLGTLFLLTIAQSIPIPEALSSYVASIEADALGGAEPNLDVETVRPDLYRVRLSYDLETTLAQDDWRVVLRPAFEPSFRCRMLNGPLEKQAERKIGCRRERSVFRRQRFERGRHVVAKTKEHTARHARFVAERVRKTR